MRKDFNLAATVTAFDMLELGFRIFVLLADFLKPP